MCTKHLIYYPLVEIFMVHKRDSFLAGKSFKTTTLYKCCLPDCILDSCNDNVTKTWVSTTYLQTRVEP